MQSPLVSSQPLPSLPLRHWATVYDVAFPPDASATLQHEQQGLLLRLSEIGFVPGEQVCILAAGMPGREPLAVRVGRSTFALRRCEADLIQVVADHA